MIDRRSILALSVAALVDGASQVFAFAEEGSPMADSIPKLVEQFYDGWQRKDLAAIVACLHPDIVFKSPNSITRGKDAYAEGARQFLSLVDRVELRNAFYSADGAMTATDYYCIQPIGLFPIAERMAFKDALIVEDQLFFDTRPFEALTRANAAAKQKP
jgi:hypothetical protein